MNKRRHTLVPLEELPIWITAEVECVVCGRTEVMVYPVEMERWECQCGHWNNAPDLPEEPSKAELLHEL